MVPTCCLPPTYEFLTTAEVINDVLVKGTKIQIFLNVNILLLWKHDLNIPAFCVIICHNSWITSIISILVGHTLPQECYHYFNYYYLPGQDVCLRIGQCFEILTPFSSKSFRINPSWFWASLNAPRNMILPGGKIWAKTVQLFEAFPPLHW